MGVTTSHLTAAAALLQCGPPLVMYISIIAPRSLLILVTLAGAFIWASTLLMIATLLRGLLADDAGVWRYAAAVTLAVSVEEAVRWWLYSLHRRGVRLLNKLASLNLGWTFSSADQALIAFATGYGQALAHALVFSVSWFGQGVLYTGACEAMSHAPAAAFTMLGLFFLHAGSTLVAFDGAEDGNVSKAAAPGALHLAAGLLTTLNMRYNSCATVAGIQIVVGSSMCFWAAAVYSTRLQGLGYSRLATEHSGEEVASS